jgi:hypothetical protein
MIFTVNNGSISYDAYNHHHVCKMVQRNTEQLHVVYDAIFIIKGTVQWKLTWVKSGINRKLLIWAWAAWGLFYILRGLGP